LKKRIWSNLKLLERRTNKVLCELLKEKLERQAEEEELEMKSFHEIELNNVIREDVINNTLKDKNTSKEYDTNIQDHGTEEEDTKYIIPTEKNKKVLDENEIELE